MHVFYIQQQVFSLKPELKPEGWDDPLPDSEYNRMFGDLVIKAEELCKAGKATEALEKLESFVFIGPGESLEEKAKGLIAQIRGEYGV